MDEDELLLVCLADNYECWLDERQAGGGQLSAVSAANGYITEDFPPPTFYVAEDGGTIYVQES
jgi:hypothetical protein